MWKKLISVRKITSLWFRATHHHQAEEQASWIARTHIAMDGAGPSDVAHDIISPSKIAWLHSIGLCGRGRATLTRCCSGTSRSATTWRFDAGWPVAMRRVRTPSPKHKIITGHTGFDHALFCFGRPTGHRPFVHSSMHTCSRSLFNSWFWSNLLIFMVLIWKPFGCCSNRWNRSTSFSSNDLFP